MKHIGENKKYILLIFLDQAQSETENKTIGQTRFHICDFIPVLAY